MVTGTGNGYFDGYNHADVKLYLSCQEAIVSLEIQPEQTLYQQLADSFAEAIHQGTLKPGKRLPAIRRVAQSHQVSVNTVLNAWQLLENRGLIEARPQSGYYVRGVLPVVTRHTQHAARVIRDPSNEKLDLIDKVFAAQNHPDYINISLACPQDSELFPSARLARITASLLRRNPNLIGRYALPPGSERLREEIARRALHAGQSLTADDITLTHGCMEALQLALRAVTQPGDCVGLESPTYFFCSLCWLHSASKRWKSPPIRSVVCRWMRWKCCCRKSDFRRLWRCPRHKIRWVTV